MTNHVTEKNNGKTNSFFTVQRVTIFSAISFFLIYITLLLIGLISAIIWKESAATYFDYLKNLLSISLSITSIIIITALSILIIQTAILINLLKNQIKPVTQNAKEAISTLTKTANFIQIHAVSPILQIQGFLTGLSAFLHELIQLNKLLRQKPGQSKPTQEEINNQEHQTPLQ